MRIAEEQAMDLSEDLLKARGAPSQHAALQARVLIDAELKGHPSHGLQRLPRLLRRIGRGVADPETTGKPIWRAEGILEVDGRRGLGPVVAMHTLSQLDERRTKTGIALAAIRNSNHLGMLAFYVEEAARRGAIAIALSTSEALVHPYGGTRAMLGTNPIAIAVPTAGRPFVLDLATSTVSMGKIHHHASTGKPIPEGWARDAEGRATTDAEAAKAGSLAPFGDAKGYGLGLAIELLVAALAGSALSPDVRGTLDSEHVCNKGDVFILVDPVRSPDMAKRLSAYLDAIRSSPPAEPGSPVQVPGDGADHRRARSRLDGFEIDDRLWAELNALSTPSHSALIEGRVQ
ncbi:MAG: dehydrogenase [Rhizobiales bacterium]|nr:dehydrogenase [Hyphomicrobiales bacterium]MBA70398.1 dehydrogenase [Hyphomicrobiales bacterium]